MDSLPEDFLVVIVKKITVFEDEDLLRFEMNSKYHQKLTRENEVLRALPRNCLWYLTDHWPSEGKCKFMQKISRSGHVEYSVVTTAQILEVDHPDLEEIRLILMAAADHLFDGAKYFELMLNVLPNDGFSMEEIFPIFKDLFDRKRLENCGRALMNIDVIPLF